MEDETIGGRYKLEELLGHGGMAEVWSAEDTELGRRVAIKILGRDSDRDRFAREARAVAALSHPSVCQLYDYGATDDDRPYMVLEYLSGGSLEDRLEPNEPLDDADASRIAAEIAAGLAHAHSRGLIHRDLKPANVLFDAEGRAKIADFGIARIGTEGTLTEAGTVLGTAAYISPEQAAGEPATAASDVYSFGVILYRLLAGRLPFESPSALELVRMHQVREVPPITEFRGGPPPALEALALAALQKDPAARPPDGAALAAELGLGAQTELLAGAPTHETGSATQVIAARGRGRRPSRPRRKLAPIVAALAVLLIAGGALAVVATQEPAAEEDEAPLTTDEFGLPSVGTIEETGPETTLATTDTGGEITTEQTTQETKTTRPATTAAPSTTRSATTRPATTAPPPDTFTEPIDTLEPPPTTTAEPPPTTEPPPGTTTVEIP